MAAAGVRTVMNEMGSVYSIGQVSQLLGIPAPTIRSWERRHGLQPDAHTAAGHRRYDIGDIAALRRMRAELTAGRGAAEAASIVRSLRSGAPTALAQAVWAAAHRFDAEGIAGALDRARALHGLTAAVELVLLPAMREIGQQWSRGACDVAHEHLATAAAQEWLSRARRAAPFDPAVAPIVLGCAPTEQHTLALDAFAVLLAQEGARCLHLGAQVPAASLRKAVRDSGARAVVLTCQVASNHRSAGTALQALTDIPAALYYAGAAFHTQTSRRGIAGRYLGESLARAAEQLATPARQDQQATSSLHRSG